MRHTRAKIAALLDELRVGYNDTDLKQAVRYLNGQRTCDDYDRLPTWAQFIADVVSRNERFGIVKEQGR